MELFHGGRAAWRLSSWVLIVERELGKNVNTPYVVKKKDVLLYTIGIINEQERKYDISSGTCKPRFRAFGHLYENILLYSLIFEKVYLYIKIDCWNVLT